MLSIVKDTVLSIVYAGHYINLCAIDLRERGIDVGHMQAILNHETKNV